MTTKAKIIIGVSGVAVLGFCIHVLIKNHNDKKLITKIHSLLDGRINATGLLDDYTDVFSGDTYINKVKAKLNPQGKYFIILKPESITEYRRALYDAIDGMGTDWDVVLDVFNALHDKVEVAQVAQSYINNYKESLLTALKDDLDDDENKQITAMIADKLNYRIAKK